MKRSGLIIGKFMPPHLGHMALIGFARQQCEKLTVLVGARPDEPIPGILRDHWLKDTYKGDSGIIIDYTEDDLPDAPVSSREVSQVWAEYLAGRYPEADVIFSSEKYGEFVAEYMGIEHVPFDPDRSGNPVSASMIRNSPALHWEWIIPAARPYFLKTVCLYGPESTGKTVMAEMLARRYDTAWVPEVARDIIGAGSFSPEHVPLIGPAHAKEIMAKRQSAGKVLFVDSDVLTTEIYTEVYFGFTPRYPDWVYEANSYDLYLLFFIDTPWYDDPQRDLGNRRGEMYKRFLRKLEDRGSPYILIRGNWEERFQKAAAAVDDLLRIKHKNENNL